jgi:hypothetical protein
MDMDGPEKNGALEVLQSAFEVDLDAPLEEFKTEYHKWLLQGNHPDTGGTGQNFDRVRQAYHVYVKYLTHFIKKVRLAVIQLIIKNLLQMLWRTETMPPHSPPILELYAEYHLRNFIEIGNNNRQHSLLMPKQTLKRPCKSAWNS